MKNKNICEKRNIIIKLEKKLFNQEKKHDFLLCGNSTAYNS